METQAHMLLEQPSVSLFKSLQDISFPLRHQNSSRAITKGCLILATHLCVIPHSPKREKDEKKNRIIITGMGLVSVFGNDINVFERLLAGEIGISLIDGFDIS